MSISVSLAQEQDGIFTVNIAGSLDAITFKILQDEINPVLEKKPKVLVFNLEHVTYVSSMGISVILRAKRIVEENGGRFIMMSLQPKVQKVFDIIKALPVHTIFTSREELDRYLTLMQAQQDSGE